MGCVASRAMNEAEQRGQARTDNGASCNGVEYASREQDEHIARQPKAGQHQKDSGLEHRHSNIAAEEDEDEGGPDSGASPPTEQQEDANDDRNAGLLSDVQAGTSRTTTRPPLRETQPRQKWHPDQNARQLKKN